MARLPTEIILAILSPFQSDAYKLRSLRLVSKQFYHIINEYFPRFQKLSLHYGVTRSIPQMEGVLNSPLFLEQIKTIYIPSESFFPFEKDFKFDQRCILPWSRELPSHEETPPPHDDLNLLSDVLKPRNLRVWYTRRDAQHGSDYPFHEDPSNLSTNFSLTIPHFQQQFDSYLNTLIDLLEACPNLEAIDIAAGVAWDTKRMNCWVFMFRNILFPLIAKRLEVKKLRIAAPNYRCLELMLPKANDSASKLNNNQIVFPGLEFIGIIVHGAVRELAYLRSRTTCVFPGRLTELIGPGPDHSQHIWETFLVTSTADCSVFHDTYCNHG
ncbi:hypothetical protein TWF281_011533 [Arthrobotrys megalospora]